MITNDELRKRIEEQVIKSVLDEWATTKGGRVTQEVYKKVFDTISQNLQNTPSRIRVSGSSFRPRLLEVTRRIQEQLESEIARTMSGAYSYRMTPALPSSNPVHFSHTSEGLRKAEVERKLKEFNDRLLKQSGESVKTAQENFKKVMEEIDDYFKANPLPFAESIGSEVKTTPRPSIPVEEEILTKEQEKAAKRRAKLEAQQLKDELYGTEAQNKAADRITKANLKEYLRVQQLLDTAKTSLPGTSYQRLEDLAVSSGFKPEDISRITKHAPSGIFDVSYLQNADGITKKLNVTVDRFGGIIERVNRRLQPFGTAVMRDTLEFIKWSAAVSLVLVPLQQLSEMTQTMVENQTKLINVLVAVGDTQKSVNDIFDEAYEISKRTGESVSGVIEAFTFAYRATGGTVNELDRFTVASDLLTDSLTLSKLTTLDEAQAIDILSAALKQSSSELANYGDANANVLTKGEALLDKWVKTSKVANVSVEALATSFSIVGDSADAVGLSVDELNGVIGTLGEITGDVSGKELGNMARALVGGFQSDKAKNQLQSLGIAVEDTSGQMRDFYSIIEDVASLADSGVIDSTQFNELTMALGGGVRRQNIWTAFISDFSRVKQISQESMTASGDSANALEMQLTTVSTAATRMANSFDSLAQTLGTKGGLLDLFTSLLNVGTGIVDVLNSITGSMGRLAPILALTLGANALINAKGADFKSMQKASFSNWAAGAFNTATSGSLFSGLLERSYFSALSRGIAPDKASPAIRFGQWAGNNVGNLASAGIIGAGVVGTLADETATSTEKLAKTVATIAGGILGALVSGGNPVGAAIGSSAANALVNTTLLYKTQWEDFFKEVISPDSLTKGDETTIGSRTSAFSNETIYREFGKLFTPKGSSSDFIFKLLSPELQAIYGKAHAKGLELLLGAGSLFTPGKEPKLNTGQIVLGTLFSKNNQGVINEFESLRIESEAQKGLSSTIFSELVKGLEVPENLRSQFQTQILNQLLGKDISISEYKNSYESLKGFTAQAPQLYAAFGSAYQGMTGRTSFGTYEDIARISTYASTEEINFLVSLTSEWAKLYTELQGLDSTTADYANKLAELNDKAKSGAVYMTELKNAILSQKEVLDIVDLSEYPTKDIERIISSSMDLKLEQLRESGFSGEEIEAWLKSLPDILIRTAQGNLINKSGISLDFLSEVTSGRNALQGLSSLGFQTLDISQAEFERAMAGYAPMLSKLTALGYREEAEPSIVVFDDGTATSMRKDWKIVQYLLSQILDTEKKQLEGFYNFPDGMSPFIPYSAVAGLADYAQNYRGGGGGIGVGSDTLTSEISTIVSDSQRILADKLASGLIADAEALKNLVLPSAEITTSSLSQSPDWAERHYGMYRPPSGADWIERMQYLGGGTQTRQRTVPQLPTSSYYDMQPNLPGLGQGLGLMGANIFDMLKTTMQGISTKLSLNITDRITLHLDGRVVAAVVKNYLKDDLVRYVGGSAEHRVHVVG